MGRKYCRSQRGHRRPWPTESTKQGSHGLTETEMSSVGPAWIIRKSSVYILWLLACCACENSDSRNRCISDSCPLQQLFCFYWTAVSSLDRRTFVLSYCIFFVLSSCHFLETCSFLKRRSWGHGSGREGRWVGAARKSGLRGSCCWDVLC